MMKWIRLSLLIALVGVQIYVVKSTHDRGTALRALVAKVSSDKP